MSGAYISEVFYTGPIVSDFIEVAVPSGTDVSGWSLDVYNGSGGWLLSMPLDAANATMVGHDLYVFDKSTSSFPSISENYSIALIDGTGTVVQYLALYDPPATAFDGPATGQTPTYAGVTAASGESVQSTDHGATYATEPVPNAGTIPCFAAGTHILTPQGNRLIDDFVIGDLVTTMDNGPQPIRWIGRRHLDNAALQANPNLRPIQISEGVLGCRRNLLVSPQHGMLLGRDHLVRAKHLIEAPRSRVRIANGRKSIIYFHLLFESHQIIFAEGSPSESFYPGPMAQRMLNATARAELRSLFPSVCAAQMERRAIARAYGETARVFLTKKTVPEYFNRFGQAIV